MGYGLIRLEFKKIAINPAKITLTSHKDFLQCSVFFFEYELTFEVECILELELDKDGSYDFQLIFLEMLQFLKFKMQFSLKLFQRILNF